MAEGRLPKIALKWMPKQKRARGRPKKNWMEGIRKAMNERNLNEGQWEAMESRCRTTYKNVLKPIYIYTHNEVVKLNHRGITQSKARINADYFRTNKQ